jgi:hypothetical protein
MLVALQSQYAAQGFSVIGLAVDDTVEKVRSYAQQSQITYPVAMADAQVTSDYGNIVAVPTAFVVDRRGIVRYTHLGVPPDRLSYQKQIEELLAERPPASSPAAADAARLPDIAGSYTLVSINGTTLPFTVTHEGPGIQVTSGAFIIRPSGEAQSREVSATYTRDGSKLTMQWQGAGMTSGNVEGETFTMENEGQVFLYRKAR